MCRISFKLLFSIIITALLLSSCKSKKYLTQTQSNELLSNDSLWTIINTDFPFEWIEGKAKLKVEGETGFKGKFYLRIRKDSAALIAIKKLSQEGARFLVEKDTLSYINRLDQTYQIISMDDISDNYGVSLDFTQIQTYLSGNAPNPNQFTKLTKEQIDGNLHVKGMYNGLWHELEFDMNNGNLIKARVSDRFETSILINYSDYRIVADNIAIPMFRSYKKYEEDNLSSSIELEYTDFTLNSPKPIRFNIPQNYRRIE